jgi:hypothetical protein
MVDYSLDSSFDIFTTEEDDFAVVDGLDEFQEDVVVTLNERLEGLTSNVQSDDAITEKVRYQVVTTAREMGVIDEIRHINIFQKEEQPETLFLEVIYSTGDFFKEEL